MLWTKVASWSLENYGGPKFYNIVKHERPGTGFYNPHYNLALESCGENYYVLLTAKAYFSNTSTLAIGPQGRSSSISSDLVLPSTRRLPMCSFVEGLITSGREDLKQGHDK